MLWLAFYIYIKQPLYKHVKEVWKFVHSYFICTPMCDTTAQVDGLSSISPWFFEWVRIVCLFVFEWMRIVGCRLGNRSTTCCFVRVMTGVCKQSDFPSLQSSCFPSKAKNHLKEIVIYTVRTIPLSSHCVDDCCSSSGEVSILFTGWGMFFFGLFCMPDTNSNTKDKKWSWTVDFKACSCWSQLKTWLGGYTDK